VHFIIYIYLTSTYTSHIAALNKHKLIVMDVVTSTVTYYLKQARRRMVERRQHNPLRRNPHKSQAR